MKVLLITTAILIGLELIFMIPALNNVPGIINIGLLCFLIGIYEEFLLRGWLLNEFLERYFDFEASATVVNAQSSAP